MRNIVLKIAYDGSDFFGWQSTQTGPSVEASLQAVLKQILGADIILQAASRTDRGVHADGQVINFFTSKNFKCPDLIKSLNALLPKSISVLAAVEAPLNFHPTLDVLKKTYLYQICSGAFQSPKHRFFSWHVPYELNIEKMYEASKFLIGEHDFSAFCNFRKNLCYEHTRRTIFNISFQIIESQRLSISITGNHFLYKMARNLVGTLVYVGRGKIAPHEISGILSAKQRQNAGITAPAHGLSLHHIFYPKELHI